jgi:hypothetical protein
MINTSEARTSRVKALTPSVVAKIISCVVLFLIVIRSFSKRFRSNKQVSMLPLSLKNLPSFLVTKIEAAVLINRITTALLANKTTNLDLLSSTRLKLEKIAVNFLSLNTASGLTATAAVSPIRITPIKSRKLKITWRIIPEKYLTFSGLLRTDRQENKNEEPGLCNLKTDVGTMKPVSKILNTLF